MEALHHALIVKFFLQISSWKGVFWIGKMGKLSPRYISPFEILEWIGIVACISRIHTSEILVRPIICLDNGAHWVEWRFVLCWAASENFGSQGESFSHKDYTIDKGFVAKSFGGRGDMVEWRDYASTVSSSIFLW